MSEYMKEQFGPYQANIVNDDPLDATEYKIARLSDDIKNAEMFGDDTSMLKSELQPLEDIRDYLNSRDPDDYDVNKSTLEFDQIGLYEDTPLSELYDRWAMAEDNVDNTTSTKIQDELFRRLEKQEGMTHDLRSHLIDIMHAEMMNRRKGVPGSTPELISTDSTVISPELVEVASVDTSTEEELTIPVSIVAEEPILSEQQQQSLEAGVKGLKLVLNLDTSDNTLKTADQLANERIQKDKDSSDEKLKDSSGIRKFLSNMWQSATYNHRFRVYRTEAERGLRDSDVDMYGSIEDARRVLFDQFSSEYSESIHTDAGEKKNILTSDHELAVGAKKLIYDYCSSEFNNDKAMDEARNRMIADYHKNNPNETDDLLGEGITNVSNLIEIAKTVKGMVEHGESIDNILGGMEIIMGEARSSVRTERHYNSIEKAYDKLARSKIGDIASGAAVISGLSMAMSFSRWGSQSIAGSLTRVGTFSAVAATIAGFNKNKEWKDHRANDAIDAARGRSERQADDKVRELLASSRYEITAAKSIPQRLEESFRSEAFKAGDVNAVKSALEAVVWADVIVNKSDKDGIDLIGYSNPESIVQERLSIDIARAQARAALEAAISSGAYSSEFNGLNDINQIVDSKKSELLNVIDKDVDAKDACFNSLKRKEVIKASIKSALIGATVGVVFQEVGAAFDDTRLNLYEQLNTGENKLINGVNYKTMLAGMFGGSESISGVTEGVDLNEIASRAVEDPIKLSNGSVLHNNQDGTFGILNKDGSSIPGIDRLSFDSEGALSESSADQLNKVGIEVIDKVSNIEVVSITTDSVDKNQFIDNFSKDMTEIHRVKWMNNDTASIYDKNELGLKWAGENGTGVTQTGYQLNIGDMAETGSYNSGDIVNIKEALAEGHIKAAISVGTGSQNEVFMVPIDSDGNLNIEKGSPVAQLLDTVDGRASFNGGYIEIVNVEGIEDGITQVEPLATLVGSNDVNMMTIEKEVIDYVPKHTYDIVTTKNDFIEASPVIAFEKRDIMKTAEKPKNSYGYYGERDMSLQEIRRFKKEECSPRINQDPGSVLNIGQELDWYSQNLEKKVGRDYVDTLNGYIEESEELKNIDANTKAIMTIPVNACGEADNIYHTLSLYSRQDAEALSSTLIILHVNWFDQYVNSNTPDVNEAKQRDVQRTFAEIDRAKREFPNLRIAIMNTQWEKSKKDAGEYGDHVIGHVARRMFDVAMMSIDRSIREGRRLSSEDIMLIRNDSDAQGMSRDYLRNMLAAFEKNPDKDVFTGAIHWGVDRWNDLPGFAFVSRFREIMHITAKRSNTWPPTVGINVAARMSTLAAVGGLGHDPERTGAGTDDYNIGGRIKDARQDTSSGRNNRTSINYTGMGSNSINENYNYHCHVAKADIDTEPMRLLQPYLNKAPITGAWGDWSSRLRDENISPLRSEDLVNDSEGVIKQIEDDMTASLNDRFCNLAHVRSVLSFMVPKDSEGKARYEIVDHLGDDHRYHREFRLTGIGRDWFINEYLTKTNKNRYLKGNRLESVMIK